MYDKMEFLKGLVLGLAGKPLDFAPWKEPQDDGYIWKTLCDGLVSAITSPGPFSDLAPSDESVNMYNAVSLMPDKKWIPNDSYFRVTVDGETIQGGGQKLGNKFLHDGTSEDTGESFYFWYIGGFYVYTRKPGPISIKIEWRIPEGWCSYNGIIMPPLPEFDEPFAMISYGPALRVAASHYYDYSNGKKTLCMNNQRTNFPNSQLDSEWGELLQTIDTTYGDVDSKYIWWTNTDLLYEDGSVAFKASKPVPIYEKKE